jgi:ferritin-like metal-binding protein YciE
METGLVSILQNHAAQFDNSLPTAAARLREHIRETQQHADRLRQCLQLLNATPSSVKSTLSSLVGYVEGSSTLVFRDPLVKDTLTDYGSEQFEVACYTALVAAANELNYPQIAALCQENLDEDLDMAVWLLEQIPTVIKQNVARRVTVDKG